MFKITGKEFYPIRDVKNVTTTIRRFITQNYGIVYPHEIGVAFHGWVDVAGIVPATEELYAFEIKEKGDTIATGIEQCKGYQSAFDYTYIAGTVKPKKESLLRMERLGIGYVQVSLRENLADICCLLKAPLNHPLPKHRALILSKFVKYSKYGKYSKTPYAKGNKTIESFVTSIPPMKWSLNRELREEKV